MHREVVAVVDRQLHADEFGEVDVVTGRLAAVEGERQAAAGDVHLGGRRAAVRELDLQGRAQRAAVDIGERGAGVGAFEVDLHLGDALGAVLVDELRAQRVEANHQAGLATVGRSEEDTSELQSLMRISYAVFCLKKKITHINTSSKQPII